jgi:hypothetical protein
VPLNRQAAAPPRAWVVGQAALLAALIVVFQPGARAARADGGRRLILVADGDKQEAVKPIVDRLCARAHDDALRRHYREVVHAGPTPNLVYMPEKMPEVPKPGASPGKLSTYIHLVQSLLKTQSVASCFRSDAPAPENATLVDLLILALSRDESSQVNVTIRQVVSDGTVGGTKEKFNVTALGVTLSDNKGLSDVVGCVAWTFWDIPDWLPDHSCNRWGLRPSEPRRAPGVTCPEGMRPGGTTCVPIDPPRMASKIPSAPERETGSLVPASEGGPASPGRAHVAGTLSPPVRSPAAREPLVDVQSKVGEPRDTRRKWLIGGAIAGGLVGAGLGTACTLTWFDARDEHSSLTRACGSPQGCTESEREEGIGRIQRLQRTSRITGVLAGTALVGGLVAFLLVDRAAEVTSGLQVDPVSQVASVRVRF